MSTEMANKRREEEEEIEQQEKADEEAIRTDACPHCLQLVSTFPYIVSDPMRGWIECAACGVVFSPKSIRGLKSRRAKSKIVLPK